MNAPTIIDLVEAGAKMLRAAKETFFDDSTIKEAEAISKSQLTGSVETLKEQVNTQRQVIDKLVEQIKANKEMIEQHNEILVKLSEAVQQTASDMQQLRLVAYSAFGLASLSVVLCILVLACK